MVSYVVFERAGAGGSPILVRDSFRWGAFLLSILWFLWHRLWIEALVLLAIAISFVALWDVKGVHLLLVCLAFLLSLALGFEAPQLRMAALRRRGWKEEGVIGAADMQEADIRYRGAAGGLEEGDDTPPATRPTFEKRRAGPGPAHRPGLGLLDYPGGS